MAPLRRAPLDASPPHTPRLPVDGCLAYCRELPGCNAVNICGPGSGCDQQTHAPCCSFLAVDKTAKALPPAAPSQRPAAALILGPPLPKACAGLPRAMCAKCTASKDMAACIACARDVQARHGGPVNTTRQLNYWRPAMWTVAKGVLAPPPRDADIGCARCAEEAAAPQACTADCVTAGRDSPCWSCVVPPLLDSVLPGPPSANWSVDGCISCTKRAGPQWNDECLECSRMAADPARVRECHACVGLCCVAGTAAAWIAASYLSQALVRPAAGGAPPAVPPLLLCYISTAQFTLYLPMVAAARRLRRRRAAARRGAGGGPREGGGGAGAPLLQGGGGGDDGSAGGGGGGGGRGPAKLTHGALIRAAAAVAPTWFLAQLSFAWSLALTSVTSNTILSSSSCLFAFLASIALLGERPTARSALSVAAVMAGTAAVAVADAMTADSGGGGAALRLAAGGGGGGGGAGGALWLAGGAALGPVAGDLLAVLSAALYTAYTMQIQRALGPAGAGAGATALFFGYLGILTAAALAPALGVLWRGGGLDLSGVGRDSVALACLNGLMDYVLADFLWARAVLLLGPTAATLGLGIQAPAAAALDAALGRTRWLAAGGAPAALTLGGGALVLGGFATITLGGGGGGGGAGLGDGAEGRDAEEAGESAAAP
ncbi:MAG: hypothetical protein J3K34DRAFT_516184 [Monoraphidium minutum]|nr:MAG: hypothetical protein J3K34DRAFT_516184 [Monoraphidium minutum]